MENYPRCATCKHWQWSARASVPNDVHPCALMEHNGSYPVVEGTLANAFSMEEADSCVFTHETFGCVMHEAKE